MKILVTGANGYIGQGVVKQLLDMGFEVVANDVPGSGVSDERAHIMNENLFEIQDPYQYFEKPDVVLHLAWRDGFKHDSLNHMIDLPAHYLFLKKMCEAGTGRICVLGSMHEIGFFEGSINENTPANPQSLYGISKNALRQAMEIETKKNGVLLQWIRGFYIVGNTSKGCSVFSKIAQAAEEGKKTFPFTMGQNQFDFIDYEEFCKQVAYVVAQEKILGIINCCSGHPMKLADRVERFISDNGYTIELAYGTFPDRPYDSKAVWGNNDKIKEIMHY